MGKSSRRSSRASRSKEERKRNFKEATNNHLYNQSICKSTSKITRNIIKNDSGCNRWVRGTTAHETMIPWTVNNIRSKDNPLFASIFVK